MSKNEEMITGHDDLWIDERGLRMNRGEEDAWISEEDKEWITREDHVDGRERI